MLPDIQSLYFQPFIAIALVTICFFLYLFISNFINNKSNEQSGKDNIGTVLSQRILGFLFFGLVPATAVYIIFQGTFKQFGITTQNTGESLLWAALFAILIIPLNFVSSKKEENLRVYPQIRVKIWDVRLLITSSLSWAVYLLAYEFMFRGFLLFSFIPLGLPLAIAINTSIYAFAHVHKGLAETVGAIPLGIILCMITFKTGNIWTAFLTHCTLALTNEWFSIYRNTEMHVKLR